MNGDLLLALGMTAFSSAFIVEGFLKGRIIAPPVEFDRVRQPFFFWFTVTFFCFMAAIMWMPYLDERGII